MKGRENEKGGVEENERNRVIVSVRVTVRIREEKSGRKMEREKGREKGIKRMG